jgi:hypothetical protein
MQIHLYKTKHMFQSNTRKVTQNLVHCKYEEALMLLLDK